jgi:hypothetical protein
MFTTILLIIAAVGFAALIVFLVVTRQWGVLQQVIFGAVTLAEQQLGSGTGKAKLAVAIKDLYPCLPGIIKWFVSEATLEKWVEKALPAAKEIWEKNPALIETTAEKLAKLIKTTE